MQFFAEIIHDLLIFILCTFAMLMTLLVVVSILPADNPLKRVLSALSYRVGVTLAAGVVAVPTEMIPGVDVLFDVATPIALVWFWYTFFRDALRAAPKPVPTFIDHRPG